MSEITTLWYHMYGKDIIEYKSPFRDFWGHFKDYKAKILPNYEIEIYTNYYNKSKHKLTYNPSLNMYYFRDDKLNGKRIIYIPEKYNKEIEQNV